MNLRRHLRVTLLTVCSAAAACTPTGPGGDGDDEYVPDLTPDPADEGCPPLFAQGIMPSYHLTISDGDWAALQDEFLHRMEREAAGLEPEPYHPAGVRYEDGVREPVDIPGALVRLKGASSWLQTISLDENPKMQFVIAFNEVDPEARFLGVRKVELDMPRTDHTFIRQRLALHYLRTAGTLAQCANNARLYINGEYYGLYTHLERLDKEFLQLRFPEADNGDLWKSGRIIKTNEDTFTWDRIDALWHDADTPAELEALADVDFSIYEWAAEAMSSHADGYYNGRANFFLYDHPQRGFLWIPHDADTAFDEDFLPATASPQFPSCVGRWEPDWRHYLMMLNEPTQMDRYVAALTAARGHYDAGLLQEKLDTWSAQVAPAAEDDPHRPFTLDQHDLALERSRDYIADRAAFVDEWLACRRSGGADGDGDGFAWCRDCNDADPARSPSVAESCNGIDDNCNGRIDDLAGGATCQ